MDNFLKQDVFFFVTTVAVIVLAILLAVFLVYLIRITRTIKYITDKAKKETDLLSGELALLRENIRSNGFKLGFITKFFSNWTKRGKKH